jgi:hypothetical protein
MKKMRRPVRSGTAKNLLLLSAFGSRLKVLGDTLEKESKEGHRSLMNTTL